MSGTCGHHLGMEWEVRMDTRTRSDSTSACGQTWWQDLHCQTGPRPIACCCKQNINSVRMSNAGRTLSPQLVPPIVERGSGWRVLDTLAHAFHCRCLWSRCDGRSDCEVASAAMCDKCGVSMWVVVRFKLYSDASGLGAEQCSAMDTTAEMVNQSVLANSRESPTTLVTSTTRSACGPISSYLC
eukprot:3492164-Amphidinium_carterae.1